MIIDTQIKRQPSRIAAQQDEGLAWMFEDLLGPNTLSNCFTTNPGRIVYEKND